MVGNLNVVVSVVVEVEDPVQLAVHGHSEVLRVLDALTQCLPGVLLHLDVVELPEIGEPLDQLGGVVLVELDVREIHLKDGRGGVADPEEHELGLPQVHGGEGGVVAVP